MGRKIASSKPSGVIAIYKVAPWVPYYKHTISLPYLTNDAYAAKAKKQRRKEERFPFRR